MESTNRLASESDFSNVDRKSHVGEITEFHRVDVERLSCEVQVLSMVATNQAMRHAIGRAIGDVGGLGLAVFLVVKLDWL